MAPTPIGHDAPDIDDLRGRARSIRRTASTLGGSIATSLAHLVVLAGEDTWIGPTPSRCRDDLQRLARTCRNLHDELLAIASSLEARADLLASAALPVVVRS